MTFEIGLYVNSMKLAYEPVIGRRTVYITLTLGKRTLWLQRWESERSSKNRKPFAFSRDKRMAWTAGVR
jgi:hypothetical protein